MITPFFMELREMEPSALRGPCDLVVMLMYAGWLPQGRIRVEAWLTLDAGVADVRRPSEIRGLPPVVASRRWTPCSC